MHKALKNWELLNKALMQMTESECEALLKEERRGAARSSIMNRIYGRYSTLRAERERRDLLRRAKSP